MKRREFILNGLKAGGGIFLSLTGLRHISASIEPPQHVTVNIPSYTIQLQEHGQIHSRFPCRVGAPWAPTPIGKGRILQKRDQVVFRYLEGPREGEIITQTYLDPEQRWEEMPYNKLRGMDFNINGRMSGAVFHSTTDYWTIGTPKSHGCIGLRIGDMLVFYEQVNYPLPALEIGYQTIFYNLFSETVILWCDIYGRGSNNLTNLFSQIGLPERSVDAGLVQHNLEKINQRLQEGHQIVQKLLRAGKNPQSELHRLSYQISRDQILWWRL
ncbi:MAG TPA: L,D-transpeptidase [bacterium]|nr:L,D-transpeptidase [bacterium]